MAIITNHTMQKRMLCLEVFDEVNGQASEEGNMAAGWCLFVCGPISDHGVLERE